MKKNSDKDYVAISLWDIHAAVDALWEVQTDVIPHMRETLKRELTFCEEIQQYTIGLIRVAENNRGNKICINPVASENIMGIVGGILTEYNGWDMLENLGGLVVLLRRDGIEFFADEGKYEELKRKLSK